VRIGDIAGNGVRTDLVGKFPHPSASMSITVTLAPASVR
jgi:hypothetical protein